MKIEIIKCLQDNYAYIVIDEASNLSIVVDPSESKPIIDYVETNKLFYCYSLLLKQMLKE